MHCTFLDLLLLAILGPDKLLRLNRFEKKSISDPWPVRGDGCKHRTRSVAERPRRRSIAVPHTVTRYLFVRSRVRIIRSHDERPRARLAGGVPTP